VVFDPDGLALNEADLHRHRRLLRPRRERPCSRRATNQRYELAFTWAEWKSGAA